MSETTISKNVWSNISREWAVGVPPWRPSSGEMAIYEDYLKKIVSKSKSRRKAIILGATPELRDLLAQYKINTTLADINPNMIRGMKELLEYSDGREKVVLANWLNIPLPAHNYDVIYLDQGLHWIHFKDWGIFLKDKARLLKPGGYFINNIVTIDADEIISMAKFIELYQHEKILTREDKFYFSWRVICGLPDHEGKKYYKFISDYNKELAKYLKRGAISPADFKFLFHPWGKFNPVCPVKEAIDEQIGRHFQIKSVRVSFAHPIFTCHKIYLAQAGK